MKLTGITWANESCQLHGRFLSPTGWDVSDVSGRIFRINPQGQDWSTADLLKPDLISTSVKRPPRRIPLFYIITISAMKRKGTSSGGVGICNTRCVYRFVHQAHSHIGLCMRLLIGPSRLRSSMELKPLAITFFPLPSRSIGPTPLIV